VSPFDVDVADRVPALGIAPGNGQPNHRRLVERINHTRPLEATALFSRTYRVERRR
jgi:hypothetical protein